MNDSLTWVLSEFLRRFMQLPSAFDLYAVSPQSNLLLHDIFVTL